MSAAPPRTRPVDSVVLAVATLAGLLYEYTVTGLLGGTASRSRGGHCGGVGGGMGFAGQRLLNRRIKWLSQS